jgi:hypothetical protein
MPFRLWSNGTTCSAAKPFRCGWRYACCITQQIRHWDHHVNIAPIEIAFAAEKRVRCRNQAVDRLLHCASIASVPRLKLLLQMERLTEENRIS